MCLYPRLINNPKYKPNKKNGGTPPICRDERMRLVPIGCQNCMECKKQKARAWSIRLQEEVRTNKLGEYITLTFSNKSIKELKEEIDKNFKGLEGYELDNAIATLAIRWFLERWRKKYKVSVKHWLVTELGHKGTENIHIHGILFKNKHRHYWRIKPRHFNIKQYYNEWTPLDIKGLPKRQQQYLIEQKKDIEKIWKYGFIYIGDYVNEQTINYVTKYITKTDLKHSQYNAKILTSAGIGSNYINRTDAHLNKYKKGQTREYYTTRKGVKINLPIYWRNKIYTEEERENLWIEKLDKNERWVNGIKVSTKNGPELYYNVLRQAQIKNITLGYGNNEKNWNKINYENQRRKLQMKKRLSKFET